MSVDSTVWGVRALLCCALWGALIAGCSSRKPEGGECVFNDDCSDPLVCAGASCRAQCRTNRDCPSGWACNNAGVPGKQVCLPPAAPVLCAAAEDCPSAAVCDGTHRCRWRCGSDVDCSSRRASLTCVAGAMCSEPILVIELQLQPTDGGPSDGGPSDATAPDVPDLPTTDAPVMDVPTSDMPTMDLTALDVPGEDLPAVDAPTADVPVADAPVAELPPVDVTPRCGRDFQCDDGVFCNGGERCDPTDPAADARGCAPPNGPRCMAGQRCDEHLGRCLTMCELTPDADGDGYASTACGGPDCDDSRAGVHPGAPELCDGIDNDCDRMVDEEGAALCALRSATAACMAGACTVATCSPGRGDCDGVGANGCETDVTTSGVHCGMCGHLCSLTLNATAMVCRSGACAVNACQAGFADCDGVAANGCELDIAGDVRNCGRCGGRCTNRPNAVATCVGGTCGLACAPGRADCDHDAVNGCEVDLLSDRANCGVCAARCAVASDACVDGNCLAQPYASSGVEGAYAPTPGGDAGTSSVVVLAAGVHHFTTVTIPAGVTVVTDGAGVLEILATGDVVIDGVIDVSGGRGGSGSGAVMGCGSNGGGGATGRANQPGAAGVVSICAGGGGGGAGASGGSMMSSIAGCGQGGTFGGGAGGAGSQGGGGGGGVAGGGGASTGFPALGGAGASVTTFGTGGAGGDLTHSQGYGGESRSTLPAAYRGEDGNPPRNTCTNIGQGGGGSIGARAAMDLALDDPTTFRAGSGGGGGAGAYANCGGPGAGGGGGGGGALRIASASRIVIHGSVLARGGDGGLGAANGGGTAGGGGGGSGGAIDLSAPAIEVTSGLVSAAGGLGGNLPGCDHPSGHGGLGRVRLSVLPSRCSLTGAFDPPLPSAGCVPAPTPAAGQVFIRSWP